MHAIPSHYSPSKWQTYRWPAIVVALLVGHMMIMMVAVRLSMSPSFDTHDTYSRDALGQLHGGENDQTATPTQPSESK